MTLDSIDDMKDHGKYDQSHTKGDGHNKYRIQSSDKWKRCHMAHRMQPYGFYHIFKSKNTAKHEAEECREDSGCGDESGESHVLEFIKQESADCQNQTLSDITKHHTKNEGICQTYKDCRVELIVSRKTIHADIHFIWFEKFWVLQFCWWFTKMTLVVFFEYDDNIVIIFGICQKFFDCCLRHPAA